MSDLTGQQLGDYLVLRRLGKGAMAEVYLAEQQSLARRVALKVLAAELARDETYVSRFQNEARAAAALVHPNIVQVYEVGQQDGVYFIAQEYIPGKNLGQLVESQKQLPAGQVLDILRQVAAALHKAHSGGIVHRDIKPENLMLGESGEIKVADFGLAYAASTAQLTQVGVTMGTPLYMSPEQIEGKAVDVRSDLYSLGVTSYYLLAGKAPFLGDTPLSVAVQHLNNTATPLADVVPDLPVKLSQMVAKLMAKLPEARFQTPGELLSELRQLAHQASQDGWADGPENWSAADLHPLRQEESDRTRQLSQLMQQSAQLAASRWRWGRTLTTVAALLIAGIVLGAATRPAPLLAPSRTPVVTKENVLQQLFHAKLVDSPQAWRAVKEKFPDLSMSHELMADQGLARLYLRRHQFSSARNVCLKLYEQASETDRYVRRFAVAGLTVSLNALGQAEQARTAMGLFDFEDLDEFVELEPQLARMFQDAINQLDAPAP